MYDLEVMVPAELNSERIAQRLNDFKRWGLQNTDTTSIKLYFMVSEDTSLEKINTLSAGWPNNFDVKALITPYSHVAQRIMYYYSDVMQPDTARWYMRVDEDSMTDVHALMKSLESWFDWERDYHITGETNSGIEDTEYQILEALGYKYWYKDVRQKYFDQCAPLHEIEISITSNSAVKKILNKPVCRELFKIRQTIPDAQGDHTFSWAARMVKIYPQCVYFLTREAEFSYFSIYGGHIHHIHDISRERSFLIPWIESTSSKENQKLRAELTSKKYLLRWKNCGTPLFISFNPAGKIETINTNSWQGEPKKPARESIGIWNITKNGTLTIFPRDTALSRNKIGDYITIEFEQTSLGFNSTNSKFDFELTSEDIISPTGRIKIL